MGTLITLEKVRKQRSHWYIFDKFRVELFDIGDRLNVVAVSSRYLSYFRDVFPKSAVRCWAGGPGQEVR